MSQVKIQTILGDITHAHVDAIVNAANSSLLGGGGVDGAIHAAAGPVLLAECRELRRTVLPAGLPVGDAVATGAGRLPSRWVIHTVGPNRHAGQTDPALLARCFTRSLDVAAEVAPFFADLPTRIAASHLVIARSGASTVAELSAIGRPAILVPLPHALDQDQRANAGVMERAGGAVRVAQEDFLPARLASDMAALMNARERLVAMAAAAKSAGTIDAAERLADLVLRVART